jgi:5-methyltetrahydropteroyltriglutamate--homocysteine methyltransferase
MRVDQVGSLLRPAELKAVFADYIKGVVGEQELRQVQDESIREVIATQETLQLPVITDGEFRRLAFMESFGEVAGMEQWKARWSDILQALEEPHDSSGERPRRGPDPVLSIRKPVTERLELVRNRPLEEYVFAQSLSAKPVKVTLIGVDRIFQGYDYQNSRSVYEGIDDFLADVIAIERQIVGELTAAGCRYLQIDEPAYTRYVDARSLEAMRSLCEDPATSLERSIKADNAVIAGFSGVTFGLHMCRGNRESMWHREGAYDAIAETLFNGLDHHRFLLEYDTERAGSFESLRFVPRGKMVVLGLITTKVGRLETVDELKRRIEEASRYIPIEQMALSPQCGFASNIPGNLLSEDEQWRKLEVMLETAAQVWG